jgi:hypothetical protein
MSESHQWFSNGTFKSAPPIFNQNYTIHILKHDRCILTLYALLPDKKIIYLCGFIEKNKKKKNSLNPKSILTDFENASINAFKEVFLQIKNCDCFFHLNQCFW